MWRSFSREYTNGKNIFKQMIRFYFGFQWIFIISLRCLKIGEPLDYWLHTVYGTVFDDLSNGTGLVAWSHGQLKRFPCWFCIYVLHTLPFEIPLENFTLDYNLYTISWKNSFISIY